MTAAAQPTDDVEAMLDEDLGRFALDPLGHVMWSYPWGRGELTGFDGPDEWARNFLLDLGDEVRERNFDGVHAVEPIQMCVGSGHGIGKSVMVGWIDLWLMSTRPFCKGVITASTSPQLESKTVPELAKWLKLSIVGHRFTLNTGRGNMRLFHRDHPETWRTDFQTCRKENSDAFQGLHAVNSTAFYINDESSGVPDEIDEVQRGGMTDGEPMRFAFGNRTRSAGWFNDCWGDQAHRWIKYSIDSRDVKITNKGFLQSLIDDYGIDSDIVRVRVLGQPPSVSTTQFIPTDYVEQAGRNRAEAGIREPMLMGVDVARMGGDFSVIRLRKGMDARSFPVHREEYTPNLEFFADTVIEWFQKYGVNHMFVDSTGLGAGVLDHIRARGFGQFVTGVDFSNSSPDPMYFNIRSYMWGMMRAALPSLAIDAKDKHLSNDLISQEFTPHGDSGQIRLISKRVAKALGVKSQDDGDALALTYRKVINLMDDAGGHGYQELKAQRRGQSRPGSGDLKRNPQRH